MTSREAAAAENLLRRGRYFEAIDRFRQLLSKDGENPELRARCAEAYRLAGNAERAFHHFHKAASIYARNGDPSNALRLLVFANGLSPGEPDILFRMAECRKQLNDLRDLEVLLRQLVAAASAPGDRRRLWALEELCLSYPNDGTLWFKRAEVLAEAGRAEEAVGVLRAAREAIAERPELDIFPMLQKLATNAADRPLVGMEIASLLYDLGRWRDGLSVLVYFYEKYPGDLSLLEHLLIALEALGAGDKAIAARLELLRGRVQRTQRDSALNEIEKLLTAAPENPLVLQSTAEAMQALGEQAEAAELWRRLARVERRAERRPEFHRAVLELLRLEPDDPEALQMGAQALRRAGRPDEAAALEERRAAVEPKAIPAREVRSEARPTRFKLNVESLTPGDRLGSSPRSPWPRAARPPSGPTEELSDRQVLSEEPDYEGSLDGALQDAFTSDEPTRPRLSRSGLSRSGRSRSGRSRSGASRHGPPPHGLPSPGPPPHGPPSPGLPSPGPPPLRPVAVEATAADAGIPIAAALMTPIAPRREERFPRYDSATGLGRGTSSGPEPQIEETTARIAQLVADELLAMRILISAPAEGTTNTPAPSEPFSEIDARRPTLRHRLVEDLYEEAIKFRKI